MYLKSIHFKNIKLFKDIELDFERPDGTFAGWTVFMGGNTSGKTTLLQGIALTLLSPYRDEMQLISKSGWLRRNTNSGEINSLLQLNYQDDHAINQSNPDTFTEEFGIKILFDMNSPYIINSITDATTNKTPLRPYKYHNTLGWFASGYGPMRRLSGSSQESSQILSQSIRDKHFITLFREDASLSESHTRLMTLRALSLEYPNEMKHKELMNGIRDMLNDGLFPHGMTISKITVDQVFIQDKNGLELPMHELSDGYRGVYALVLDLIQAMADSYGVEGLFVRRDDGHDDGHVVIKRSGVVLIDEVEAHLHPTWQQQLPEWLKNHFPGLQFLVTTHSPLVAQAADPNGVFVLPSPDDPQREIRRLTGSEYDQIRLGRAEKTLLGAAFGLKTVRSRWANQEIKQWKRLDAKKHAKVPLTESEIQEHARLRAEMAIAFDLVRENEVP
ncbi:MAG: AAA family ATPase [Magnetococcales bacterium]|nr:AAA family ATPase [Magnetococcales bacterium]